MEPFVLSLSKGELTPGRYFQQSLKPSSSRLESEWDWDPAHSA
jgi:hypothetical protein